MEINKEWHLHHIMPKNPTIEERIEWHLEHKKNCRCRDIPEKLKEEMKKRKIKIPASPKNQLFKMKKIDLKKEYAHLYKASAKKMEMVTVPKLNYLMIDGTGDPNNSKQFQEAIEGLYSLSYTIKFMFKKGPQQIDYGVMPLEALWWTDDMNNFSMKDKAAWKWTVMIMQPEFVNASIIKEAKELVRKKKLVPALDNIRFEAMEEGLCAHILYIGPYNEEPPTIVKLHDYIKDNGYKLHGKHREIYLNDMRRTAPDKLKTIIRQPVTK